jgi:hypothetical protein
MRRTHITIIGAFASRWDRQIDEQIKTQGRFFVFVTFTFTVSTTVVLGCLSAKPSVTNNPVLALRGTFRAISFELIRFEGVGCFSVVFFAMVKPLFRVTSKLPTSKILKSSTSP